MDVIIEKLKSKTAIVIFLSFTSICCIFFQMKNSMITEENNNRNNGNIELLPASDDEILNLLPREIDEKLVELTNSSKSITRVGEDLEYLDESNNVNKNKDLFNNEIVRSKLVISYYKLDIETENNKIYVNKDKFIEGYQELWGEGVDLSNYEIKNNKVMAYEKKDTSMFIEIDIPVKEIIKDNDTYIIKTFIKKYNKNSSYKIINNLEGQIKFKKIGNYYRVLSFIVIEI